MPRMNRQEEIELAQHYEELLRPIFSMQLAYVDIIDKLAQAEKRLGKDQNILQAYGSYESLLNDLGYESMVDVLEDQRTSPLILSHRMARKIAALSNYMYKTYKR
jgi:hypothetical protein